MARFIRRTVIIDGDHSTEVTAPVFEAIIRDRLSRLNLTPDERRSMAKEIADMIYGRDEAF